MRLASLALFFLAGCAAPGADLTTIEPGPPVYVDVPPRGSLSATELAAIAADIREVETNPLGAGAEDARSALLSWLTSSPDVSVALCEGVVGAFTDSRSRYRSELLAHFTLGLAATRIETPSASTAELNLGAMQSAITAYEQLLDLDERATDSHMERMIDRSQRGTLDEFVENATVDC